MSLHGSSSLHVGRIATMMRLPFAGKHYLAGPLCLGHSSIDDHFVNLNVHLLGQSTVIATWHS